MALCKPFVLSLSISQFPRLPLAFRLTWAICTSPSKSSTLTSAPTTLPSIHPPTVKSVFGPWPYLASITSDRGLESKSPVGQWSVGPPRCCERGVLPLAPCRHVPTEGVLVADLGFGFPPNKGTPPPKKSSNRNQSRDGYHDPLGWLSQTNSLWQRPEEGILKGVASQTAS